METMVADTRPRLLIVDDRADRRTAIAAVFRDSALVPVEASTAEATATKLASLRPAAAILAAAAPSVREILRAAAVPVLPVAVDDVETDAGRDRLVADTYRAMLRANLKRILVVDDDETYRTILSRQLAPFCERVHATGDPRAGLAAVGEGSDRAEADCLVLDLVMPQIDGFAFLRRMRAAAATIHLPVVVCSSKALSPDEQDVLRSLRAPFLPKDALTEPRVARVLLDARRLADLGPHAPAGSAGP